MSNGGTATSNPPTGAAIPLPILVMFRGIGQVFFQENALTGVLFVLGIALSSPLMAVGAIVGSAIGATVAWALKYDQSELRGGIFGFNSALVGIASFFFFVPGPLMIGLMLAGCVGAAIVTRFMRTAIPFPTYTTPFIVVTWGVYFLGNGLGLIPNTGAAPVVPNLGSDFFVDAITHGIGQVMFQASIWTGLLFLLGIALSDRKHALLVLTGSVVGMLVALYHFTMGADAIDPERLIVRSSNDVIKLGLYGYNATLAPVALYLCNKSLTASLMGMLLTVPLAEFVPMLGLPALTAPFVLATWLVLALGWLEGKCLSAPASLTV
ncbi:urea transporter [Planctomicrobium sp. SH527]|uniref:urea transporter n=1 Tax=Planctomicrobium sp. SH527 TaxID=3448123 RepID=UPI003F5BDB02